jgi:hypothetical protein
MGKIAIIFTEDTSGATISLKRQFCRVKGRDPKDAELWD